MAALTFYYPVLDALSRGPIIRKTVAVCLRALGILLTLAGLAGIVAVLKLILQPNLPVEATIGGLLLIIVLATALWCVVQVCFYRARTIALLPNSDYTVVPIISLLLRALGEIAATLGVAAGVGGFLAILLSGPLGAELLEQTKLFGFFIRPSYSPSSFIGGLFVLGYAAVMSFGIVLTFYVLAEGLVAIIDIARRVEAISSAMTSKSGAPHTPAACLKCGAQFQTDSEFCDECGAARTMAATV